ncbi:unnamed protein product [Gongylonema pulchrum]|uniref:SEA domain-containing protein n=1 Tax=Gongylonema pulchrum TaxID=637853 RepID=A0A183F0G8_9BILA|nr:unnamed protein product [Gongylonema pulchrum]
MPGSEEFMDESSGILHSHHTHVTDSGQGSEEFMDESSGILHSHHTHVTDSGQAKEGSYRTPFSFRITSIDYTPEFGDPDSGKYKKLQDQLLPDVSLYFEIIFLINIE